MNINKYNFTVLRRKQGLSCVFFEGRFLGRGAGRIPVETAGVSIPSGATGIAEGVVSGAVDAASRSVREGFDSHDRLKLKYTAASKDAVDFVKKSFSKDFGGESVILGGIEKPEDILSSNPYIKHLNNVARVVARARVMKGKLAYSIDDEGVTLGVKAYDMNSYNKDLAEFKRLDNALIEAQENNPGLMDSEEVDDAEAARKEFIDSYAKKHGIDLTEFDSSDVVKIPDIKYYTFGAKTAPSAPPVKITGLSYAAVIWPLLKPVVYAEFRELGLNDAEIKQMLLHHAKDPDRYPALNSLISDLASSVQKGTGPASVNFNGPALAAASAFYPEKFPKLFDRTGGLEMSKIPKQTAAELAEFKKEFLADYEVSLDASKRLTRRFLNDSHDFTKNGLINQARRDSHLNADLWNVKSADGIANVRIEMEKRLGMNVNDEPWPSVFNQLSKAHTPAYLNAFRGDVKWFLNPDKYAVELKTAGEGDFVRAWEYFKAFKNHLIQQDKMDAALLKADENKDRIPVLDSAVEGIKENLKVFTNAVRTGDYATAGIYLAGAIALWKVVGSSSGGATGAFLKKLATYGAIAAIGIKAADVAGYDLLKMAGLKGGFASVEDTNLANLLRLPGMPALKDFDENVLIDVRDVPLNQLWNAYKRTHNYSSTEAGSVSGGFIDPALLPDVYNSKFGGLAGTVAQKRKDNREFDHTGQQLYLIMSTLQKAYEEHVMVDSESPYYGQPFNTMIESYHGSMSVNSFLSVFAKYTKVEMDLDAKNDARDRMRHFLDGRSLSPSFPEAKEGLDDLYGKVAGYPVVMISDGSDYIVYARGDYDKNKRKAHEILRIPMEASGDEKALADAFEKNVKSEAKRLIEASLKSKHIAAKNLKWNGKSWVYEKAGMDLKSFGVRERHPMLMEAIIDKDGHVEHKELSGDMESILMKQLLMDFDSNALSSLNRAGSLSIVPGSIYRKRGVSGFRVRVGSSILNVVYGRERGSRKAKLHFDKLDLAKFVKTPSFLDAYVDALMKDEASDMNRLIASLDASLDGIDESHWEHWFLKDDTEGPGASGFNLSFLDNSVPDAYVKNVLKIARYQALQRAKLNIARFEKLSNFKQIDKIMKASVQSTMFNLKQSIQNIKKLGPDVSRTKFMQEVGIPLSQSACFDKGFASKKYAVEMAFYNEFINLSVFGEESHNRVRHMMEAFLFHSARFDNKNFNAGANVKLAYMDYLKEKIIILDHNSTGALSNYGNIGILTFEQWRGGLGKGIVPVTSALPILRAGGGITAPKKGKKGVTKTAPSKKNGSKKKKKSAAVPPASSAGGGSLTRSARKKVDELSKKRDLSVENVKELLKLNPNKLVLEIGNKDLTQKILDALKLFKGIIEFKKISNLHDKKCGKLEAKKLIFSGFEKLDDNDLTALNKYDGMIEFPGVGNIMDLNARAFSGFKAKSISLNIYNIDTYEIMKFSKYTDRIELPNLNKVGFMSINFDSEFAKLGAKSVMVGVESKNFNEDFAKEFINFKHKLEFPNVENLKLLDKDFNLNTFKASELMFGIVELNNRSINHLTKYGASASKKLLLPKLDFSKITVEIAKKMIGFKASEVLLTGDVKDLTEVVVKIFAGDSGKIKVNGRDVVVGAASPAAPVPPTRSGGSSTPPAAPVVPPAPVAPVAPTRSAASSAASGVLSRDITTLSAKSDLSVEDARKIAAEAIEKEVARVVLKVDNGHLNTKVMSAFKDFTGEIEFEGIKSFPSGIEFKDFKASDLIFDKFEINYADHSSGDNAKKKAATDALSPLKNYSGRIHLPLTNTHYLKLDMLSEASVLVLEKLKDINDKDLDSLKDYKGKVEFSKNVSTSKVSKDTGFKLSQLSDRINYKRDKEGLKGDLTVFLDVLKQKTGFGDKLEYEVKSENQIEIKGENTKLPFIIQRNNNKWIVKIGGKNEEFDLANAVLISYFLSYAYATKDIMEQNGASDSPFSKNSDGNIVFDIKYNPFDLIMLKYSSSAAAVYEANNIKKENLIKYLNSDYKSTTGKDNSSWKDYVIPDYLRKHL